MTYDRSVVFSIQHYVIKFVSDLRQVGGFLYTTLCDKVCQWLTTDLWFSQGTSISSTDKTDRHDITEILLNVALNTITLTLIRKHLEVFLIRYIFSNPPPLLGASGWVKPIPQSSVHSRTAVRVSCTKIIMHINFLRSLRAWTYKWLNWKHTFKKC